MRVYIYIYTYIYTCIMLMYALMCNSKLVIAVMPGVCMYVNNVYIMFYPSR